MPFVTTIYFPDTNVVIILSIYKCLILNDLGVISVSVNRFCICAQHCLNLKHY